MPLVRHLPCELRVRLDLLTDEDEGDLRERLLRAGEARARSAP